MAKPCKDGIVKELLVSIGVFSAFHILPSTRVRPLLIGKFGRRGFMIAYSLVSTLLGIWLYVAFKRADYDTVYWVTGPLIRAFSAVWMFAVFMAFIAATTAPRPVLLTGETVIGQSGSITGLLRITRHPLLWAIGLWALIHLVNNADPAGFVFFGYFAVLALLGTVLIDLRRARLLDAVAWKRVQAETSNIPFLAIIQGRNRLRPLLSEIGLRRLLLGAVLWAAVLLFHETLFGLAIF